MAGFSAQLSPIFSVKQLADGLALIDDADGAIRAIGGSGRRIDSQRMIEGGEQIPWTEAPLVVRLYDVTPAGSIA
jgi:hypothetical protein